MEYEAILFDMDGVLVDTHQSVTQFWRKYAEAYQVNITQSDFNQHVYGCPANHTLDLLFPQLSADERQSIIADMTDYEINLQYIAVKGVLALLRTLKQGGIPIALVTSGEDWKVAEVVKQLGIEGIFTDQVTAGDIRRGKPDPECYLLAAAHLGKAPLRCIVFEDSISGVRAAVTAGALCIGVGPPSTAPALLEAGAVCVVPDFAGVHLVTGKKDPRTLFRLEINAQHSLPLFHRSRLPGTDQAVQTQPSRTKSV